MRAGARVQCNKITTYDVIIFKCTGASRCSLLLADAHELISLSNKARSCTQAENSYRSASVFSLAKCAML